MNVNLPLVSILIPTYNQRLDFLEACITSALNQTYKNIEVIVSDNHSTNGSLELLEKFKDDILVVRPQAFLPINDNFDFCAKNANGQYYSFLCSDDILIQNAIERLVESLINRKDIAFACGNIVHDYEMPLIPSKSQKLIRPLGGGIKEYRGEEAISFFFPWGKGSTWMAGDLINAMAYKSTGGLSRSNLSIGGDNWITRKLIEYGGFICIDEPLALFRMRKITHLEVDKDRRLLEFADRVMLADSSQGIKGALRKLHDRINLIQRLGEVPGPGNEVLDRVNQIFIKCERDDLALIASKFCTNKALYSYASKSLTSIKNIKNLLARFIMS